MSESSNVIIVPGGHHHIQQDIKEHLLGSGEPQVAEVPEPGSESAERRTNWSNLKTPFGLIVIFGFLYWLVITCVAFVLQFKDAIAATWLFKYCVFSMLFAFTLQCCIITLVLVRSNENDKYIKLCNRSINLDALCKFLYSLLLCIDLFVHIGIMFLGADIINISFSWMFVCCHLWSLFVISFLSMKWHKGDRWFRAMNFIFEWIDIFSQIAVTVLYHRFSESEDKGTITKVFWIFTLIQILFWIPPLAIGSAKSAQLLAKQVVLLDIVTVELYPHTFNFRIYSDLICGSLYRIFRSLSQHWRVGHMRCKFGYSVI